MRKRIPIGLRAIVISRSALFDNVLQIRVSPAHAGMDPAPTAGRERRERLAHFQSVIKTWRGVSKSRRWLPLLPDRPREIVSYGAIGRHQRGIEDFGSCDNHTVSRIAMVPRQAQHAEPDFRVNRNERQVVDALQSAHIFIKSDPEPECAALSFESDLPERNGAGGDSGSCCLVNLSLIHI